MAGCKKNNGTDVPAPPTIKAVWTCKGFTDSTSTGTLTDEVANGNNYLLYNLPGSVERIDLDFYHADPLTTGTYPLNFTDLPSTSGNVGITLYPNPQNINSYNASRLNVYANQPIMVSVNGNVTTITGTGIQLQNPANIGDTATVNFVITQTNH